MSGLPGEDAGATDEAPKKKLTPAAKAKLKKDKADKKELQKKLKADPEPLVKEVKETHDIRHGNMRQRSRHGMKHEMLCAKFSPDGKRLLTASQDKSVRLWNLENKREVANFEHPDVVRCLDWSPDGNFMCTGCDDRIPRVWRVREELLITEPELTFEGHHDWVICVTYSPNGLMLCTVSKEKCVQIHKITPPRPSTNAVAAAAEVQPSEGEQLEPLERKGSKRRTSMLGVAKHVLENIRDQKRAGSKERDGSKEQTESRHGSKQKPKEDEEPRNPVTGEIMKDGDVDPVTGQIYRKGSKQKTDREGSKKSSKNGDPDAADEEPTVRKVPQQDWVFHASFSRDSELLVTSGGWERGYAIIFDVASMDELFRISHSDWVLASYFSPFDNMILTAGRDKFIRIWELPEDLMYGSTLQAHKDEQHRIGEEQKEEAKKKKKLVISKKKQKEMAELAEHAKRLLTLNAKEVCHFTQPNWIGCAAWSADGSRVVAGNDSGQVSIFDIQTQELLTRFEQQECIRSVQWSPSDRKVVVASDDSSARIYAGLQTLWAVSRQSAGGGGDKYAYKPPDSDDDDMF